MIQIQSIAFTSYNLGLHCDYHYQAYGLMTKAGAEVLHIGTLLPAYAELVEMESSIVHRQTTYVSTEQLKAADKARDNERTNPDTGGDDNPYEDEDGGLAG